MTEEFVGWLDDEWNVVLDQSQPIVRCRDCIHHASDPLGEYCTLFDFEDVDSQKSLNGYCAWGESREQ